jgi:hypothetical protein
MGDRIITRNEGEPYNSRNEQNYINITEKEHNIDISEPNTPIPTDEIRLLVIKDISRVDKKISESEPEKEDEYFENKLLTEQTLAEYASENNKELPLVSSVITEKIRMQDSGTEKLISFHEPKILLKDEEVAYSEFSLFK